MKHDRTRLSNIYTCVAMAKSMTEAGTLTISTLSYTALFISDSTKVTSTAAVRCC